MHAMAHVSLHELPGMPLAVPSLYLGAEERQKLDFVWVLVQCWVKAVTCSSRR